MAAWRRSSTEHAERQQAGAAEQQQQLPHRVAAAVQVVADVA